MELLFGEKGRDRLDDIVRHGLLCVFDFDGTLAPIVDDPQAARLPEEAQMRLRALSAMTPVAILTGRSVADMRSRLGFDPDFVVGNHGMEGLPGHEDQLQRHAAVCEAWHVALRARLAQDADAEGIWVEHKGHSLSAHYRAARDRDGAAALLLGLFARLTPAPRVVGGKCVFNLLPRDALDKGKALERLLRIAGAASAIYVGDDETDEDVFRLRRQDVLSVRVEFSESSAADFYLPSHREVMLLLDEVIVRLSDRAERNVQYIGDLGRA